MAIKDQGTVKLVFFSIHNPPPPSWVQSLRVKRALCPLGTGEPIDAAMNITCPGSMALAPGGQSLLDAKNGFEFVPGPYKVVQSGVADDTVRAAEGAGRGQVPSSGGKDCVARFTVDGLALSTPPSLRLVECLQGELEPLCG